MCSWMIKYNNVKINRCTVNREKTSYAQYLNYIKSVIYHVRMSQTLQALQHSIVK